MSTELVSLNTLSDYQLLAQLAVQGCQSPHTRHFYSMHIQRFLESGCQLNRDGVQRYLATMRMKGTRAPSMQQALSAIKRLSEEAYLRGLQQPLDRWGIQQIKGDKGPGIRSGRWMTLAQLRSFYALPNRTMPGGIRDAALLALFCGCGLRLAEANSLTWHSYQEREGRMCLVDLIGKGNKIRTVPIPEWAATDLHNWWRKCKENDKLNGHVLLALDTVDQTLTSRPLSRSTTVERIEYYSSQNGFKVSPHDLRRTIARLMRQNGASLSEIMMTLGHTSITTTKKYCGESIEMRPGMAAVDFVKFADPLESTT
jgi:site-specific recombinase XerD